MPPIINYFVTLGMLLMASAIVINGFFLSSRGYESENPDGTISHYGMILKWWYFFWYKEHKNKKRYRFTGERFIVILAKINQYLPAQLREPPVYDNDSHASASVLKEWIDFGAVIEKELKIELEFALVPLYSSRRVLTIYQSEPDYVFPEWIRKMMAGCITCHASFWGSLTFVSFHVVCSKQFLHEWYHFSSAPYSVMVFLTWIVYTLGLAYIATWLNKKV